MGMPVTKSPSECTKSELDAFEVLVIKGDKVTSRGLNKLIKKAQRLLFLYVEGNQLIGIGALKNPNLSYKHKVFQQAGSPDNPDEFTFEIGWIFIEETYRGKKFSKLIMNELLKFAGSANVYVTTEESNRAMQITNDRCGFKPSGSAYQSNEGKYKLVLFTRRAS